MNDQYEGWIRAGIGQAPTLRWNYSLEGRLTHLAVAWETDEALAADDAGGLYLFDRWGTLIRMTRGHPNIRGLAFSSSGEIALVAFNETHLALFDRSLRQTWRTELYDQITAVALDPFGRHMGVALRGRQLHIMTIGRKYVAELEMVRPIRFIRFATTRPYLIAAADDGLLAGIEFLGALDWETRLFSTAGDLAINGNASLILLPSFAHGLQCFNARGRSRGTLVVEGSISRVATSFSGEVLVAATLEGNIYRLDRDGHLQWASDVGEEVASICLDADGQAATIGLARGRVLRLDWREQPWREEELGEGAL